MGARIQGDGDKYGEKKDAFLLNFYLYAMAIANKLDLRPGCRRRVSGTAGGCDTAPCSVPLIAPHENSSSSDTSAN